MRYIVAVIFVAIQVSCVPQQDKPPKAVENYNGGNINARLSDYDAKVKKLAFKVRNMGRRKESMKIAQLKNEIGVPPKKYMLTIDGLFELLKRNWGNNESGLRVANHEIESLWVSWAKYFNYDITEYKEWCKDNEFASAAVWLYVEYPDKPEDAPGPVYFKAGGARPPMFSGSGHQGSIQGYVFLVKDDLVYDYGIINWKPLRSKE